MRIKSVVVVGLSFVAVPSARADWSVLPAVTGGGACRTMAFADATVGYLIVDNVTAGDVFATSDGGQSFAKVPVATLPTKDWAGLFVVDANEAFVTARGVGADKQVIAKTIDGGTTWALQTVTTSGTSAGYVQLDKIVFVDAANGYASGAQDETGTGDFIDTAVIYTTTNGGSTWVQTALPPSGGKTITALAFTSATTGVAVAGAPTVIDQTTNSGSTWSSVYTAGEAVRAIQFVDATNGFGFTDAELLLSTNAGASWTASATAPPPPRFNGESFLGTQTGLVNSNGGAAPWIWRTVDGGTSWQAETTPAGWVGGVGCLAYASATVQFAASSLAAETRPLKYTPASAADAGAGTPDAGPPGAQTGTPDAAAGGNGDAGSSHGCAAAAGGSSNAGLLCVVVGIVLRRRRARGAVNDTSRAAR